MNKLLATLLLSLGVSTAYAQSTVTVYGILDVYYASSDKGNAGRNTAMGDNGWIPSRLGFKGTEDLGNGVKAEFQLESSISTANGTAGSTTANETFNREAWVGLASTKLGSVRLGTTDVTNAGNIDVFVSQAGNLATMPTNISEDKNKSIRYTSPTIAGLTAEVGYSNEASSAVGGIATETTTNKIVSAFAKYEAGNLGLYVARTEKKTGADTEQAENAYGAKYNFGVASVGAYYATTTLGTTAAKNDLKQARVSVGVPVPALGSGVTTHAVYFKDWHTQANQTGDIDGYKFAVSKAFSKRTSAYVAYVDQKDNVAGSTANDANIYMVGMVHSF